LRRKAGAVTNLDPDALAFLRLHQVTSSSDYVDEWRAIFQGAMIRAKTHRGKTATLARDAVQALVDAGLMQPSYGGTFYLTEEGKRV
jgi:hypothetical protein